MAGRKKKVDHSCNDVMNNQQLNMEMEIQNIKNICNSVNLNIHESEEKVRHWLLGSDILKTNAT